MNQDPSTPSNSDPRALLRFRRLLQQQAAQQSEPIAMAPRELLREKRKQRTVAIRHIDVAATADDFAQQIVPHPIMPEGTISPFNLNNTLSDDDAAAEGEPVDFERSSSAVRLELSLLNVDSDVLEDVEVSEEDKSPHNHAITTEPLTSVSSHHVTATTTPMIGVEIARDSALGRLSVFTQRPLVGRIRRPKENTFDTQPIDEASGLEQQHSAPLDLSSVSASSGPT